MPKSSSLTLLAEILNSEVRSDGSSPTHIDYLSFNRASSPSVVRVGMLTPSFCLVVQGTKKMMIGKEEITYGTGAFSFSALDMPVSGQIAGASKARPYLGVRVELDPKEIASVALDAKLDFREKQKTKPSAFISEASETIQEALLRLVKFYLKKENSEFLERSLKRELFYHLLTSDDGPIIFQSVVQNQTQVGISKAIGWLKENYNRPLRIEKMAKDLNMSVSSLHHKFKAMTTMGPLQYQKTLRLQEARRLLLAGNIDVASAAFEVGYESPSQFNREYRRHFGASPLQDIKHVKEPFLG